MPTPAGGFLTSGTYVLTSETSYGNPIFPSPCGTLPSSTRATYRITATSATTGFLVEDLGVTYPEAGLIPSLFGLSYVADVDAGEAMIQEFCPIDSGTGAIMPLAYTVTPTGLLAFFVATAGARIMCTTVDTLAKQ